ncbi:MAG: ATP-binding protein [Eubacterium sp.]
MIKRELYLKKIRPFMDKDLIKVLTGMRRSGKSVMLELIQSELVCNGVDRDQFIHINFENLSYSHLCDAPSLHKEIIERVKKIEKKVYLFFDEIQEVTCWEKAVNSFRVEFDCDIYLTGSNATLLSGELATYLAGRYVEFVIYPFSFEEFTALYHLSKPDADSTRCFKQYLNFGGMPFLGNLNYQREASKQYLIDVYNSIILKDIVKRSNIRDVDMLEKVITYVLANIGQPFSATSISKFLKSENRKIAPETILNYLKYCEDAYLFRRARRQDLIGKKIMQINEKYYVMDHGLRQAIYGKNDRDINQILENIVFMEALRRGYKVTVGKVGAKEIDFVCEENSRQIYIQVAYTLGAPDSETDQREFGAYDTIKDNFPKYVVTMDTLDFSKKGIQHFNIIPFLQMKSWEV